MISIHAPREGGDCKRIEQEAYNRIISIHAPREGGDLLSLAACLVLPVFQSTPPARGATKDDRKGYGNSRNFNPRPPRGGRPGWITGTAAGLGISIHAPREGGDSKDAQFYL